MKSQRKLYALVDKADGEIYWAHIFKPVKDRGWWKDVSTGVIISSVTYLKLKTVKSITLKP